MMFDTLKEAEERLLEWEREGTRNKSAIVFEITGVTYTPILKLKKDKDL